MTTTSGLPGSPVVRITGFAMWGGVDVKPPRRRKGRHGHKALLVVTGHNPVKCDAVPGVNRCDQAINGLPQIRRERGQSGPIERVATVADRAHELLVRLSARQPS